MKHLISLILLASCNVAKDPKIYEDTVQLVEEVVKDEVQASNYPKETQLNPPGMTIIKFPFLEIWT